MSDEQPKTQPQKGSKSRPLKEQLDRMLAAFEKVKRPPVKVTVPAKMFGQIQKHLKDGRYPDKNGVLVLSGTVADISFEW